MRPILICAILLSTVSICPAAFLSEGAFSSGTRYQTGNGSPFLSTSTLTVGYDGRTPITDTAVVKFALDPSVFQGARITSAILALTVVDSGYTTTHTTSTFLVGGSTATTTAISLTDFDRVTYPYAAVTVPAGIGPQGLNPPQTFTYDATNLVASVLSGGAVQFQMASSDSGVVFGSAVLSITYTPNAVPEPGSLALLGIAGLAGLVYRSCGTVAMLPVKPTAGPWS